MPEEGFYEEILNTDSRDVRRHRTWATAAWSPRGPCPKHNRPQQHRGHPAAAGGGGVPEAVSPLAAHRSRYRRGRNRRPSRDHLGAVFPSIGTTIHAKYDAVIIGGGHNGLVTAAYLARAGRKVLVLERRELVGGCAVTEEIWPGYRVSTAAYLTSLLQERIVRELDLPRFGYRVDAKDPGLLLRLSRRPPFLHVAGPRQDAGRNRQILARAMPKSIPPMKTRSSGFRKWWKGCC